MKKLYTPLFVLASFILFSGCGKIEDTDPVANFTISNPYPYVNEYITFTSTSINTDHVKWTFPDGKTATSNSINYSFPSIGLYSVTLEAFNKSETVSDIQTYDVSVCVSGRVIFWADTATYRTPINIELDGKFIGTLTSPTLQAPTCGNPNGVTAEICPGTYTYKATDNNNKSWTNLVKISANNCQVIRLN